MAKAHEIEGLTPELPYREAARLTVEVRARELFAHAEGVLDVGDPERVHDMRVASRRLRAALEIYAPCFEAGLYRDVLAEVKALADALGARRDPDVQLLALGALVEAMGPEEQAGLELLAADRRAERAAGNEVLEAALRRAEEDDLAGRLRALAAGAAA